jgi:hypothetical protein
MYDRIAGEKLNASNEGIRIYLSDLTFWFALPTKLKRLDHRKVGLRMLSNLSISSYNSIDGQFLEHSKISWRSC